MKQQAIDRMEPLGVERSYVRVISASPHHLRRAGRLQPPIHWPASDFGDAPNIYFPASLYPRDTRHLTVHQIVIPT